jgi:AcrR family transcriptional regulator
MIIDKSGNAVNVSQCSRIITVTERRDGRQNQKERTRRAIVAAAGQLIEEGDLPSTAEAAEAALVSPATAYRYFPDNLSLLSAALQEASGLSARFQPGSDDEVDEPLARIEEAAASFLDRVAARERLVRAVMALSLMRSVDGTTPAEDAAGVRPGFRRDWIDHAVRPLEDQIPPAQMRRLKLALGVIIGPESLIALKDVMGADQQEAVDVCRWMARSVTAAALNPPTAEKRSRRTRAKNGAPKPGNE